MLAGQSLFWSSSRVTSSPGRASSIRQDFHWLSLQLDALPAELAEWVISSKSPNPIDPAGTVDPPYVQIIVFDTVVVATTVSQEAGPCLSVCCSHTFHSRNIAIAAAAHCDDVLCRFVGNREL